jgi:DNA polymerase elongation subunit (family B)
MQKTDVEKFIKINETYLVVITINQKSDKYYKKKSNNNIRNVSYASAIASKGRIKLYEGLKNVERDGGRILYYDTDSIFAAYPKNNTSTIAKDIK